jgi:broad specificity phosphatase PhoE
MTFDYIFVSPLVRTKQSAKLLNLKQKIQYDSRIEEKSWGWAEGLSYTEIVEQKKSLTSTLHNG